MTAERAIALMERLGRSLTDWQKEVVRQTFRTGPVPPIVSRPRPLPIDGAAYRRRTRRRNR